MNRSILIIVAAFFFNHTATAQWELKHVEVDVFHPEATSWVFSEEIQHYEWEKNFPVEVTYDINTFEEGLVSKIYYSDFQKFLFAPDSFAWTGHTPDYHPRVAEQYDCQQAGSPCLTKRIEYTFDTAGRMLEQKTFLIDTAGQELLPHSRYKFLYSSTDQYLGRLYERWQNQQWELTSGERIRFDLDSAGRKVKGYLESFDSNWQALVQQRYYMGTDGVIRHILNEYAGGKKDSLAGIEWLSFDSAEYHLATGFDDWKYYPALYGGSGFKEFAYYTFDTASEVWYAPDSVKRYFNSHDSESVFLYDIIGDTALKFYRGHTAFYYPNGDPRLYIVEDTVVADSTKRIAEEKTTHAYQDGRLTYLSHTYSEPAISMGVLYGRAEVLTYWPVSNIPDEKRCLAIKVYPNPVTEVLNLELPPTLNPVQATVSDMSGQIVLHLPVDARSIDVSALPRGTYVLLLQVGERLYSVRFVKQ